jgi:hypothetical protein
MAKRKDYLMNLQALAVQAYAKHTVLEVKGEGSYIIHRAPPDTWCFWTRVIAASPYLICVGDADTAVFRGHPSDNPLGLVHWVAQSNLSYLASKCSMGMGSNMGFCLDPDSLKHDLQEYIDDDETSEAEHEVYRDALNTAGWGDYEGARRHVAEEIQDGWEVAEHLGNRVDSRVVYAQEACRALIKLLRRDVL